MHYYERILVGENTDNTLCYHQSIPKYSFLLTNCKAKTERHVTDGIDPAIYRAVPEVHQVPQLGHHGAVHHADGKPEASHGDDELCRLASNRYL